MMTFVAIISLTAEKMTSAKRIILGMLFKVLNRHISVEVSSVIEFLLSKKQDFCPKVHILKGKLNTMNDSLTKSEILCIESSESF